MFNHNSFSIDSGNNPNNSFGFNSPQKRPSSIFSDNNQDQSNSFRNDDDDYDFGAIANYDFRDVGTGVTGNLTKPITSQ